LCAEAVVSLNRPDAAPTSGDQPSEQPEGVTPKSARRLLGSLERSFLRVRHILTPRRRLGGGDSTPSSVPATPTLLPAKVRRKHVSERHFSRNHISRLEFKQVLGSLWWKWGKLVKLSIAIYLNAYLSCLAKLSSHNDKLATRLPVCVLCVLRPIPWPLDLANVGDYFRCPPRIFLKFSGLQDSGVEKYPGPKLATKIHCHLIKNSVQFGKIFFFFSIYFETTNHSL